MVVRTQERRSSLADWSAWLSLLSIPVLIIAAIGHRSGMLLAVPTYATIAVGFALAALGVIAAAAAFEGIWRDGRKGLGVAIRGMLIGLVVLSLPLIAGFRIVAYPRLTDISTDPDDPPAFVFVLKDRTADARPLTETSDDDIALQRDAYPDIVSRHYPVGPGRVFDDASKIVELDGWRVLGVKRPEEADQTGSIEAVATTPIFAFEQDVAIRIVPDGEGALVDMRSAARNGEHDLGANADRIREFFSELDTSLQGINEAQ